MSILENIDICRVCTWNTPYVQIPPLTLNYITGCIISWGSNTCNHIANCDNFFGEEVSEIDISGYTVDSDGVILNRSPCGVFADSHVAEAFGCCRFDPAYTCINVVVQVDWFTRRNVYAFDL